MITGEDSFGYIVLWERVCVALNQASHTCVNRTCAACISMARACK